MKKNGHVFFIEETDYLESNGLGVEIHLVGRWGRPKRNHKLSEVTIQPVAIINQYSNKLPDFCYGIITESTGKSIPEGRHVLFTLSYYHGDILTFCEEIKLTKITDLN